MSRNVKIQNLIQKSWFILQKQFNSVWKRLDRKCYKSTSDHDSIIQDKNKLAGNLSQKLTILLQKIYKSFWKLVGNVMEQIINLLYQEWILSLRLARTEGKQIGWECLNREGGKRWRSRAFRDQISWKMRYLSMRSLIFSSQLSWIGNKSVRELKKVANASLSNSCAFFILLKGVISYFW